MKVSTLALAITPLMGPTSAFAQNGNMMSGTWMGGYGGAWGPILLAVVIAVDVSGSIDYGSREFSKREIAAEAAAILGFSALQNGDKVGLLAFAETPLLFVPPAKGSRHLLRLVREILTANPNQPGTSIKNACDFLVRTLRRRALVGDVVSHAALPGIAIAFLVGEAFMRAPDPGAALSSLFGE